MVFRDHQNWLRQYCNVKWNFHGFETISLNVENCQKILRHEWLRNVLIMMKNGKEIKRQDTGEPELKRLYTPGRYSMKNKEPSRTADPWQAQSGPFCPKCGSEAHVHKNTRPATGRRCLKSGRLNHFARVYRSAANDNQELLRRREEPAAPCARKIHCNPRSRRERRVGACS